MTKFVVAADVHGSRHYCEKLMDVFHREKADRLLLLGDLYYHGVRNNLPNGYEPKAVVVMLNSLADKIIAVKGNCESRGDLSVSEFHFFDSAALFFEGKSIFLSHGDVFNKENPPKGRFDAIFYGHTHKGELYRENGVIYANPGSISLPKGNSVNSYIVMDERFIALKSIDGEILSEIFF